VCQADSPPVGRLSCALTTVDAIMTTAKVAIFVCGFTPALLPLANFAPSSGETISPYAYKEMIQAYFDTSPPLRLCKPGRLIESPRWVKTNNALIKHKISA
jgi:hypothetical protein